MVATLAMGTQFSLAADQAATAVKPAGETAKTADKPGQEKGVVFVETVKTKAKVIAVDAAKRTVTFERDGKTKTVTCGPEVINFDQIKVGDRLTITYAEAMAIYIQKAGAAAGGKEISTVTLAPKGEKPGMFATDTIVLNTKIDAVDAKKGTLTITTADGKTKTLKVDKSIKELKNLKKGDDIVVRFTEALAMVIEAPKK